MSNSFESQPTPLDQNESLEEREEILFDELDLAIKWDRPSILIAVYESEFTREDAVRFLEVEVIRPRSKSPSFSHR